MVEEQQGYEGQFFPDVNTKLRDLEGKQRMIKDRLLLIGQNLVEMRGKTSEDILEISDPQHSVTCFF